MCTVCRLVKMLKFLDGPLRRFVDIFTSLPTCARHGLWFVMYNSSIDHRNYFQTLKGHITWIYIESQ